MRRLFLALLIAIALAGPSPADAGTPRAYVIRHDIAVARDGGPRWSAQLHRAARVRALELARADAPDGHRGAGKLVYAEDWSLYGEVVGWNARGTSAHWWTRAWLGSPTHRAVILGRWTHVGVSCVTRARVWCVAVFGRAR